MSPMLKRPEENKYVIIYYIHDSETKETSIQIGSGFCFYTIIKNFSVLTWSWYIVVSGRMYYI